MLNGSIALPRILLCGYERGGTTLLSDIFRSNGYESGFECGVLMCETPTDFLSYKPYIDMIPQGWGVSSKEAQGLCVGDFKQFYNGLFNLSFPDAASGVKFFDKTPIYMSQLGRALYRTEFINKACVIHRDPRSVFVSWAKRLGESNRIEQTVIDKLDNFCNRYLSYFIGSAAHFDNKDVMFIPFEDLCLRESSYYKSIGLFSEGYPFSARAKESRFGNVMGAGMDLSKILEFDQFLSQKTQDIILERTKLASIFFANASDRIKFGNYWADKKYQIESVMQKFEIDTAYSVVCSNYFEPVTYLLRYPDVLKAGVNPIRHYSKHGVGENRKPC
jgi:hypothetical protein